ncbi:MAG: PilT/PilU family type 4a pilus ATPase [Planctomycetes bacterium]|nr:PilT/PilU family type 4a pilus ATPase [Planctomycetota bacterium]
MNSYSPKQRFEATLRVAREHNASDVHIMAGIPPAYRVSGELIVSNWDPISREELGELADFILTPAQRERLEAQRELCVSYYQKDVGRLRITFYHRLDVPELAIRMCNLEVKPADELMLPQVVNDIVNLTAGLVIVTGPTGSGKTTTLNYLVDAINATRRCKIITIEDPVEYEHRHRKSLVIQIEVTTDTLSFPSCLRNVLRLDPNVICIGEMRDIETMETALAAADTGHLVLATLHTPNAVGTVERIMGCFEGGRQAQVILQLSSNLQVVIAQRLVSNVDRTGRVLACEVLIATGAVRNMIRERNLHLIQNTIATSRNLGMQTMEESLAALYRRGLITYNDALNHANDPAHLQRMLAD